MTKGMLSVFFLTLGICGAFAADSPSPRDIMSGKAWSLSEATSPLDDSRTVTAIVVDPASQNALAIWCKEGTASVALVTNRYFGGDAVSIQYRINKQQASGKLPPIFATREESVLLGSLGLGLMTAFKDGDTLFIRVYRQNGSLVDSTFNLLDISSVRNRIIESCPRSFGQTSNAK